jgi:hypothetical protein
MSLFDAFVGKSVAAARPFLVELSLHSIHEPHPAMPEYWSLYKNDPDYLGTLTQVCACARCLLHTTLISSSLQPQMDVQIGNLLTILKNHNSYLNTMIFFTADNGPHQGKASSPHLITLAF